MFLKGGRCTEECAAGLDRVRVRARARVP